MNEMVNLLVDLRAPQFDESALVRAQEAIARAGFTNATCDAADDAFLAWIDEVFGGTWSSEAYAGKSAVAKKDGAFAGFAAYDPRGLQFSWLRGLGAQAGVGIFGPFGVAPEFRRLPIGPHLLLAALASLADGIRDAGALLWPGRWRVIAGSIGFLGFDILAFGFAFAACGATPPVGPLVFGYVVGQLGGLIPLPGGVGGTDGGLIGAMVLYGASLSNAAAAVVIYRTFQLGIPAILGAIAFVQLRRTLRDSSKSSELWGGLAEQ